MQNDLRSVSLVVIMLFLGLTLIAQPKENDPYTILGLGNLNDLNFATLNATPGLTATYHDNFRMNVQNPAASGFLIQTAFEAGGFYQYKGLKTATDSDRVSTGNLSYLGLGFPLFNTLNKLNERKPRPYNIGMTLSLTPYSRVGYDLVSTQTIPEIGDVESTFEGTGGTYKFLWGTSFRYKNVSAGLNIGYLFGKQSSEHWDYFLDLDGEFRNRFIQESRISGFIWNAGVMYEYVLPQEQEFDDKGRLLRKPRTRITMGVYGNSQNRVNTSTDFLYERRQVLGSIPTAIDTIPTEPGQQGRINLPAEVGAGLMIARDGKWRAGFDYTYQGWANYVNDLSTEQLNNSFRIAVGAEYTPNLGAYKGYAKRITYRLGGYYKTDPRNIEGIGSFSQKAITFGVGLPVKTDGSNRSISSSVNLAAEIGQYGNPDFLKETYFKLTIGFTLNDNLWFYKSKYN